MNTMEVRSAWRMETTPNLVPDVVKVSDRSIFLPSFGEKPSKPSRPILKTRATVIALYRADCAWRMDARSHPARIRSRLAVSQVSNKFRLQRGRGRRAALGQARQ